MKTISKSQYLLLKMRENYETNLKNETVEITDEEYNNLIQYSKKPIIPIDDHSETLDEEDPNLTINTNANNELIPELSRLEFPHLKGGNSIVVTHRAQGSRDYDINGTTGINYSLEWDCDKKAPRWVCYQMNHEGNNTSGTGNWVEDPEIPYQLRFSDTHSMYVDSGYVRGHLVASADRLYSKEANEQVFYYSNSLPMFSNFNGGANYTGVWVNMEDQVRSWGAKCETLYVVKGGTIDNENQILMRVKPNVEGGLIVPKYFFMAMLAKTGNSYKALGFWAEHNNTVIENLDLRNYVVTINELEELTGIDFFCNLPDDIEKMLESKSRETIINEWFGSN